MCGICGTFGTSITKDKLSYAVDRLAHRGPDDRGVWMDGLCGLGHRRLSILDITEAGHQPFETIDGRYHIVFNGEVYNFLELRKELLLKGYSFKSDSDTEVVLYSYVEWGLECQNKFNGMWAFAIYDQVNQELFISKDRFGIKPLYYARSGNGYVFGSEMKSIIPMLDNVTVSEKILTDKNRYMNYEATEECLIKEINRLKAGHCIRITKTNFEIKRWWNTLENLIDIPREYNEQVELFRELFLDACRIRMRSDVTLGTALSGGLDSSATICGMAYVERNNASERVNNDYQHAFVASMPGTSLDETIYAKEVTDYLGIELTRVEINPIQAISNMADYMYKFEDVYLTSPVPMMQTYKSMKNHGVTVTLDGHGADELFGGYTGDMLYVLLDVNHRNEIDEILNVYYGCMGDSNNSKAKKSKRYCDFIIRDRIKRILGAPTWDAIMDSQNIDILKHSYHYDRTLYNSTHMTILPTLLRNYDRYSMASGVEIRMPFMDYRLVELAFSINWKSKLRGGYSKAIIRDALKDIMPNSIVYRKSKVGFSTPLSEWAQGPWREWLLDEINSQEFINSTYIDGARVRKGITNIINGDMINGNSTEQVWMDIMPYLWEKYFLKRVVTNA